MIHGISCQFHHWLTSVVNLHHCDRISSKLQTVVTIPGIPYMVTSYVAIFTVTEQICLNVNKL